MFSNKKKNGNLQNEVITREKKKKNAPEAICSLSTQLRQLSEDAAKQRDEKTDPIIYVTRGYFCKFPSLVRKK